jgi:osmotically-inducible protein OsmY
MKNDIQIQRDVVAELDHDQNVAPDAFGVEVHHGVVKLAGRVSESVALSAELAARRVPGVTAVVMDTGPMRR